MPSAQREGTGSKLQAGKAPGLPLSRTALPRMVSSVGGLPFPPDPHMLHLVLGGASANPQARDFRFLFLWGKSRGEKRKQELMV